MVAYKYTFIVEVVDVDNSYSNEDHTSFVAFHNNWRIIVDSIDSLDIQNTYMDFADSSFVIESI